MLFLSRSNIVWYAFPIQLWNYLLLCFVDLLNTMAVIGTMHTNNVVGGTIDMTLEDTSAFNVSSTILHGNSITAKFASIKRRVQNPPMGLISQANLLRILLQCRAPLLESLRSARNTMGTRVTPGICGAIGERVQVILVWVRARGVGNAFHLWRLGVTRIRPRALDGSWHCDSRMPKNTSIKGVGKKLWGLEWDCLGTAPSSSLYECCGEGQYSLGSDARESQSLGGA